MEFVDLSPTLTPTEFINKYFIAKDHNVSPCAIHDWMYSHDMTPPYLSHDEKQRIISMLNTLFSHQHITFP